MLTIQKSKSHKGKCVANILPCRVNHSGPVDCSRRYWDPRVRDSKETSYFRGRKLYARRLKVPVGYRGVVVVKTGRVLPPPPPPPRRHGNSDREGEDEGEGEEEEDEEMEEVKIMEEVGWFGEVLVWEHESVADEGDVYVRGVEEWVGFAESIHTFDRAEDGVEKEAL